MLAVTIHEDEEPSASGTNAALDGRSVADVVGVTDHVGAPGHRRIRAAVRGTVVDHDDFRVCQPQRSDIVQQFSKLSRFVEYRNDDRDFTGTSHGAAKPNSRDHETN